MQSFGAGIFQGVTGLLVQPARGLREGGASGLMMGFGKGIVGAAVKPTAGATRPRSAPVAPYAHVAHACHELRLRAHAGALDFASRTAQGIANQVGNSSHANMHDRVRPPRTLDGDARTIKEYSIQEAIANEVLVQFRAGKHKRESLVFCADLLPKPPTQRADLFVLTERRVLLVEASKRRVKQHFSLDAIDSFAIVDGSLLSLTTRQREAWRHSTVTQTRQCVLNCVKSSAADTLDEGAAAATPMNTAQRIAVHILDCGEAKTCSVLALQLEEKLRTYMREREALKAPQARNKAATVRTVSQRGALSDLTTTTTGSASTQDSTSPALMPSPPKRSSTGGRRWSRGSWSRSPDIDDEMTSSS